MRKDKKISIIYFSILLFSFLCILSSCSLQKQISHSAKNSLLGDSALKTAHIGISIYEPATGKYWFNYQGDKYFVPASNTKIPTCYAAMKYLGDSLVGLKYGFSETEDTDYTILAIQPTGDPSFLHPDFKNQPVFNFLSQNATRFKYQMAILDTIWKETPLGNGWSWNDYEETYMAERSSLPVYGNLVSVKLNDWKNRGIEDSVHLRNGVFNLFRTDSRYFDSLINRNTELLSEENILSNKPKIRIHRELAQNEFFFGETENEFVDTFVPFAAYGHGTAIRIISDSLKIDFGFLGIYGLSKTFFFYYCPSCRVRKAEIKNWHKIYSQPTDSLLKPMMHRSDNFFAEQTLLMVSNERLGVMNDEKIIDTLLKTDFKELPQKPRWVDGSGLSRYNLFSPQDFVAILNKMKNEFGMKRIENILPTGGTGTLTNYYKADSGYIFAKTGSLSGVIALSGYLYTKKKKLLIFSILVNNHQSSPTTIRRVEEKFLEGIRNKY